ncbi:sensor domain-containing diguanylate cyclase [Bacillus sp. 31A1R]|uniref:Sensor domain-containing diguanylate cyclase n=1 Tax=Robertmurraya mangrovi TaxID=3098077 RepID=A0ABU5J2W9_9BACI|nr:sensor domain-containing diguanylate cyclase [Bacillus sp. 31A1R]MDZ5473766.1 sensor domain-containing diguanylate cyclase [Bacillus sp. 31A1R]
MKKRLNLRKVRLSTLLTSLVAASVIFTTVILLIASYQSEKSSLINAHLNLNYSKSNKMSKSVDSLFKSMNLSLKETSEFLSNHEDFTDDEIQEHLELLRSNSRYFNSLSWIDEKGEIRSIAPSSTGLRGVITSGITKEVVDSKKSTLTSPYIAPSGRLIVLMSFPIYGHDGEYRGMIGGSIYLHENNVLNEILGNDLLEENGSYYYVVGPKGKLLFHPDNKRVGDDVKANPVVQKLLSGQSGMEQVTNTKGISMIAAYSNVPETGWGIVQQTPYTYVDNLLKVHIQKLIFSILPYFIIVFVISIVVAQMLAKPYFELAYLANQLASGKEVKIPKHESHWNWEADRLSQSVILAMEGIQEKNHQLSYEAMTDSLTSLPNRRKLDHVMNGLKKDRVLFSLIIMDIDHFKMVNDTHGHQAGDDVLRFIAEKIQKMIRKTDNFFRYGGEEFILILPYTPATDAILIAEKIRENIENTITPIGLSITVSMGVSEFPLNSNSLGELFQQADNALYHSKAKGRNSVTLWSNSLTGENKQKDT